MSAITELRAAISSLSSAKDASRKAGDGLWAWYVRAMAHNNTLSSANDVDAKHTALKGDLDDINPLSKDERNSLAAAKSVVRAAIENGKDLWKRDDTGSVIHDAAGQPMPRGKSDLQNDRLPFDVLMRTLEQAEKLVQGDKWETPTPDNCTAIALKVQSILASCGIK